MKAEKQAKPAGVNVHVVKKHRRTKHLRLKQVSHFSRSQFTARAKQLLLCRS